MRWIAYFFGGFAVFCGALLAEIIPSFAGLPRLSAITLIADWHPLIRLLIAGVLGALLFHTFSRLLQVQATWEFGTLAWFRRSAVGTVYSILSVVLGGLVAKLVSSVLADYSISLAPWVLVLCGVGIFLGVMPAVMFIKGLQQTGVHHTLDAFDETQPLPVELQPDTIIMAMSRSVGKKARMRNQGFDAILTQLEKERPAQPLKQFIEQANARDENLPNDIDTQTWRREAITAHSWFQSVRSLHHHFYAASAKEKTDRKILILVSDLEEKDMGVDIDLNGGDLEGDDLIGFQEFISRLMRLRFGESVVVECFSETIDIFDFTKTEATIRAAIAENHRFSLIPFPRMRRITVDVTSGPKPYSIGAGAATFDGPASVSYVMTIAPYSLLYRRLQPRR